MTKKSRIEFLSALAAVLIFLLNGCQKGNSPPENAQPSAKAAVTGVFILPSSATLQTGVTQQFSSNISGGTSNASVRWEVNAVPGGNSTVGTISGTGLYTAPASTPEPPTVKVTAISQADPSKAGSAEVRIIAPDVVTVVVQPATAIVSIKTGYHFKVEVFNTKDTAVSWQVNGIPGGNSTLGTISPTGAYKAPIAIPTPATITITAISHADPTKSGTVTVTIRNINTAHG